MAWLGCTGALHGGRQLKEAIGKASSWQELVCTQSLAIGQVVLDDQPLPDLAAGASISLTRRPLPEKVLAEAAEGAGAGDAAL